MASAEKLLAKMRRLPPEMRLADVQKVLEHLGWSLDRITDSHFIYDRGADTISIPHKRGMVKRVYLQQILDRQ